jgi:hypothetical protein
VELEKVRALGLPPADEDLILSKNLLKLIRRVRSRPDRVLPTSAGLPVAAETQDPWLAVEVPEL